MYVAHAPGLTFIKDSRIMRSPELLSIAHGWIAISFMTVLHRNVKPSSSGTSAYPINNLFYPNETLSCIVWNHNEKIYTLQWTIYRPKYSLCVYVLYLSIHVFICIHIRGVMVHALVPNIFGKGISVQYACVPNKSFNFFQEIQTINSVVARHIGIYY